jgi:hypothetical protein
MGKRNQTVVATNLSSEIGMSRIVRLGVASLQDGTGLE